jgi:hypothetical protein
VLGVTTIMNDKPGRDYKEWLRNNAWPFFKRGREGADSIMPHLQEFLEQSRLLPKRGDDESQKEKKSERDNPRH